MVQPGHPSCIHHVSLLVLFALHVLLMQHRNVLLLKPRQVVDHKNDLVRNPGHGFRAQHPKMEQLKYDMLRIIRQTHFTIILLQSVKSGQRTTTVKCSHTIVLPDVLYFPMTIYNKVQ